LIFFFFYVKKQPPMLKETIISMNHDLKPSKLFTRTVSVVIPFY